MESLNNSAINLWKNKSSFDSVDAWKALENPSGCLEHTLIIADLYAFLFLLFSLEPTLVRLSTWPWHLNCCQGRQWPPHCLIKWSVPHLLELFGTTYHLPILELFSSFGFQGTRLTSFLAGSSLSLWLLNVGVSHGSGFGLLFFFYLCYSLFVDIIQPHVFIYQACISSLSLSSELETCVSSCLLDISS